VISARRLPIVLVLLLSLAASAGVAASAAAVSPREYRTTVEATDDTDFTIRTGKIGDSCGAWSKIEGHVVTTITPARRGVLTLYDLGKVGTVLGHSPLASKVVTKLRTTGNEHASFPCGCGPTSELGKCPPDNPVEKVNGSCTRRGKGSGQLGLTLVGRKLAAMAAAPVNDLLEDCPLAVPGFLADDVGLPEELRLPASDMRAIKALKVGGRHQIRETFRHAGRLPNCTRSKDLPEQVCGVLRFEMEAERVEPKDPARTSASAAR